MSRGKYLSLEEARKHGKIDQFIKEHDSKADKKSFNSLLDKMTRRKPKAVKTSKKV